MVHELLYTRWIYYYVHNTISFLIQHYWVAGLAPGANGFMSSIIEAN